MGYVYKETAYITPQEAVQIVESTGLHDVLSPMLKAAILLEQGQVLPMFVRCDGYGLPMERRDDRFIYLSPIFIYRGEIHSPKYRSVGCTECSSSPRSTTVDI